MWDTAPVSRVQVSTLLFIATTLTLLLVGGLALSTTPEAEVNVSAAAGYQGQADVAVDPVDPAAVMVVGTDDGGTGPTAWSSVDGGNTYASTALPLTFDGHAFDEGSEPSVAVDLDGTWYAAYEVHDLDGGMNPTDSSLVVARSFDGLVWEAATIVEDNRGAGADPSVETPDIAVDPSYTGCTPYNGRVQVVWVRKTGTDRAIYQTYSTNGGDTWYTLRKINDGSSGTEDVWRPRVAVGPDGRVYAAWLDDLQSTIVVDTAANGGTTWGTDVNAASVTLGCGTGDCGNDLGCSGGALHGSTPALAVDTTWTSSRGTVYLGFSDEPGADGLDVLVTSSTNDGVTWSAPVQVHSVATRQQYGPALAVHPVDGSVHAVWYDRRNDSVNPDCETETWHAVSTDGGATWADETAESSLPSDYDGDLRGEGAHASVATVSTRVFPLWTDNRASNHEIYLARIARVGGTVVPGGNLDTDTTWLAADGPFIVTGDQTIDPGVTLTIEAGTEVRFATCDDLRAGVDASRVEIIVEGVLDVQGVSGNEVQFLSGDPAPEKSDWYGLRFQNTADSSDSAITFASILHTQYGIRLSSSSPTLEDVTIELATYNGIEGSARTAVPFSPTRVVVTDTGESVNLYGVSGTWTDVTLQDSTSDAGWIRGGSLDLRLVGLSVLNNAAGGLTTNLSSGGLEVILSEFNGNGATEPGLTLDGYGPRTLVANDFESNSGIGLELNNDSSGWPAVAVYYSNFSGNGGSAVRMEPGSLPADARRNYWGGLNGEMGSYPANVSGIWDIHDNPALRHVDFRENQGASLANDGDVESYLAFSAAINDNETVIYGGAVAREGILRVEVSTNGGADWSEATVEGAAFSMAWAPTPGMYTIMSRVTDALGTVEAVPDQKTVNVSAGPTLSGTMLADETWTPGPTIVLEGDVVVPAGVTLTIDPGTTVHAQYLTDSAYGGLDPSRIEIIVEGVLESNGAAGNEVVWESSRVGSGALKGDWYGIRYTDTTTDELSIVQDTDIGHGVNCLKLENAAPDVIDSTIENCSQDGLSGTSGSLGKLLWVLSGNTIQDNDGDGVDVTGNTEVEVIGGTMTGNGGRGLDIDASPNVVTVTNSTVSNNGGTGLWVNSGSAGFNLLDSAIQNNGGDGVYVSNGGIDIRLERLLVTGNGDDGVEVASGTELVLLKSSITGNERGVRIGSPRLVGAYNTITGNTGDLVAGYQGTGINYYSGTGVPAVIGMSDLENSVDYEVYMTTSRALNARRNYWGAVTTTNMNAAGFPADLGEFYDIHEDRTHGVVDYDNWAAASVSGSAPGDLASHITWPGTGTTMDVTSVVITGVAYATDGIDRVEVCVRGQGVDPPCGDGGGETPYGVVTGMEGWTFEWFPPSSGTFELQTRVVDTGEIKSVPAETITYVVNLLGPVVTGPIAVSGPIIADQTWSGDIELTGDVIVEAGHTLTIAAGTNVEARALVDDRLDGEDTSRIELIVRGNLVTQGTGGLPVSLTSTRPVPERRDWYGIRFESISDASLNDMDWTSVEAGWYGIEFRDTFSALDEVSGNNNFAHGLYLSTSTAAFPTSATITGGSFLDNGSHGIYLYSVDGTWLLDDVEMGNNDSYGMYVYGCNTDGPFTLDGVNVHDNVNYGTYLYNCSRPLNLLASTFDGNVGHGFQAYNSRRTTVRASTFTNQTGTGLVLSYPDEIVFSKNTFSGNAKNAWVSDSSAETQVVFNDFGAWTDLGDENVEFSGGSAAVFRNAHFNNFRQFAPAAADIQVRNAVAASVNARANYWDPDTTTEMNGSTFPVNISSIQDVEDNPAWGRVDYRAHLASAVNLAPAQVCGFTSPVDGDTLTGTTFTLRGAAAADAGILQVDFSTDGVIWTPAVGEELWTYEWTPGAGGNYDLYCRVTDLAAGVQAVPTTINVDVIASTFTTSGILTGDETWFGVVVLTGDVTVPDGITLTIQDGTSVRATPQSDDQFSGVDTSKIELIIQGTLNLQGVGGSPVEFTSNRTLPAVPTAGDWYGIRLTDTADSTVTIHHAVIEAGVRGIWGYPGSHHDVTDCVVRDMTDSGIYMQFGTGVRDVADPGIEIRGNTVERTGSNDYGIYLYRSGSHASWNDAVHVVDGNTTDDNGSYGMYLYPGYAERTEITNNVVSNASYGIYVNGTNNATYTNRVELLDNQVSDPVNWGVYFYGGRDVEIADNTITGGGSGIYTYNLATGRVVRNNLSGGTYDGITLSASGGSDMTAHRNTVSGYGDDGFVASSLASLTALYNDINTSGQDALQVATYGSAAVPRIHWNNVRGSTAGYDFNLGSSHPADVKHNFWDASNGEMQAEGYPSEISEIFDIADNDGRGRVDYRGVENLAVTTAVTLESRFVWPFDGDTMSNRTITLEGTAYADDGVQLVEISTDGGMNWSPATGADFWTYTFTPTGDGPQTFLCRVTDNNPAIEPTPDSITVTFDSSLPTTEGTLPSNESWTGPSPIVLTGDVIVPFGTTLTIDAGTTLQVQPLADNSRGGVDLSRIELIVEGTLDLQGTGMSPVTITSDGVSPLPGDWYGVRLTDTADSTVTIHDLVLEYGVRGIWGYPGSHHDVIDCTVRDMTDSGIWMQFGTGVRDGGDPGMLIEGNTVERTGSNDYGIYLSRSGSHATWNTAVHQLVDNTTDDTGSYGMYVYPSYAERTEVTDNIVSNASYGIYVSGTNSVSYTNRYELTGNQVDGATNWGLYQYGALSALIEQNTVTGGGNGIYTYQVREGRVVDNDLDGGTGDGMSFGASGGNSDIYAYRNQVANYGDDGIISSSMGVLVATHNTITNVGGDAIYAHTYTAATVPHFHWNNIQGSTAYDAYLGSTIGADLRRNYWAGTNAEMLAEGYPAEISEIFDIEDNTGRGRIDYRGVENLAIETSIPTTRESQFVWPFDNDTLSRRTITVEGTAYAEAGVQLVEISTNGGADWMPATGTDYWMYSFTPAVDGLQEFRCRVTDGNSVVETTPDVLIVDFDFSLPTTEGTMPANETWSGPTPIVLTGDVLIPAGVTLTIDPGTTIQVQPLADNSRGGVDWSRIELIVEGTLIAQGTVPTPIQMTSDSTTPAKGHWYGIRYDGVPRPLTELRNLSLEWGVKGISDTNNVGIPDLDGIAIQQMQEDGVRAANAPVGTGDWTFRNLDISLIDQYGFYVNTGVVDADVVMENTTIQEVGRNALYLDMDATEDLEIRDSTFDSSVSYDTAYVYGAHNMLLERVAIHHTSSSGESLYVNSSHIGDNLTIDDSEITGGNRSVYIYRVTNPTIRRSRITDGTTGVYLYSYSSWIVNALLENNRISDTTGDGVYLTLLSNAELHYNDLYNIGGYTLNNQSASDVDAADNYWGEDTETEMVAKGCDANIDTIYDQYDNGSKGRVTYCDHAPDPFGDQPTIYFHEVGGNYEIHWFDKADLTYDLIRGDLANLAIVEPNVDLGAVICEAAADGSGVIIDVSPDPAVGQGWFFLMRDHTTPGDYGLDSAGRDRVPASGDCP